MQAGRQGREAATDADAFVAFSYPPDTIAITDTAKVLELQSRRCSIVGVGTAFPIFKQQVRGRRRRDGHRRLERRSSPA